MTADETSGALKTREGVLKSHNETARALAADGRPRLALMRTGQRVGGVLGPPAALGQGDEPNVLFSVKNTDGDFRITSGFDEAFLRAVIQRFREALGRTDLANEIRGRLASYQGRKPLRQAQEPGPVPPAPRPSPWPSGVVSCQSPASADRIWREPACP